MGRFAAIVPCLQASFTQGMYSGRSNMQLLYTLRKVLIRHTKAQVLGGQAVLQLPPKTEELVAGGAVGS